MLGAMTLALVLGAAPMTASVLAAEKVAGISQSAVMDALRDSDIIDVTKRGSVTIHKYDLTAAEAAGDYTAGSVRATGESNAELEHRLADYAVSGVQFSCLRVGNAETHSINEGTDTSVELVYEIPEELAEILKLTKADSIDMTSAKEAVPCHNTGVFHYTSQQISDALNSILKADNVSAKNALEQYLYDYGTMDSTTDQIPANGVVNLAKTNEQGVTTIEDMELGLYLFAETEVPEQVTDTVNPWFVQLPFTNEGENGGDEWLYDMAIYPKNQTGNPTLDKSVRNAYSNTVSASSEATSGVDKNKSVHVGADYISQNDSESLVVYHTPEQGGNPADRNQSVYVANRGGYTDDGITAGQGGTAISTDFSYRDTTTASEGDVLDYILVSKLPHISSKATYLSEYTFTDTLSKGITYGKDAKIAFYDNAADANANNTANAVLLWNLASGDYSQRYVDVTVLDPNTGAHTSDGTTKMKVSLTEAGLQIINQGTGAVAGLEHGLSDYYMVVYYTATVHSDDSVILGDEGNPNNVNLIWSRTSDGFYNMLEDRNYVYSYGLNLTKTFSDQKGDFQHVKFKLYNSTDAYYVVAEKSQKQDGVYYVTGKTTDPQKATAFIPGAKDGKLIVNGTEADTYQLTEIETDDGYNLLKDQIVIDITSTDRDVIASVAGVTGMDAEAVAKIAENYQGGIYDENGNLVTEQTDELYGTQAGFPGSETANGRTIGKTDMYVGKIKPASATVDQIGANMTDKNGAVILTVNNTRGFLLPQTGGTGVYLVTILGAVALAGGYCLVIRKKELHEK